ncbi:MAG: hypothetical protein NTX53_01495 [candidate division WOR-3 bacterium]|nr:hypothetical protein [candidate division WOR-3 bacterium]
MGYIGGGRHRHLRRPGRQSSAGRRRVRTDRAGGAVPTKARV